MKEEVLEPCGPLLLLFSLSLPSVVLNPSQLRDRHFWVFRHLGIRRPAEPESRPQNMLRQPRNFLQYHNDEAFMVRLAAFHDLPSAFTHHLWFSFFYSTDAYVRLSVWTLHEQNGGSRGEWNSSWLRGL